MFLWLQVEGGTSIAFLPPKKNKTDKQLVVFHMLLLVSFVNSAPYFCMGKETVTYLENESVKEIHNATQHPLEYTSPKRADENRGTPTPENNTPWSRISCYQQAAVTAQLNVYRDDFISAIQGGPVKLR